MPERYTIDHSLPLRDQVAEIVRIMILNGELKGDQQIKERTLSQLLKVSTTPVKEAFRLLQAEGLIYSVPNRGAFVSPFSKHSILQATFVRSSIEGVAAYLAAESATDAEIAEMEAALDRASQAIDDAKSRQTVSDSFMEFHKIVRKSCRNPYLINLMESLRSIDNSVRTVNLSPSHEAPYQDYAEHRSILEAIKSHDPDLAERLMRNHIRRVAQTVIDEP